MPRKEVLSAQRKQTDGPLLGVYGDAIGPTCGREDLHVIERKSKSHGGVRCGLDLPARPIEHDLCAVRHEFFDGVERCAECLGSCRLSQSSIAGDVEEGEGPFNDGIVQGSRFLERRSMRGQDPTVESDERPLTVGQVTIGV